MLRLSFPLRINKLPSLWSRQLVSPARITYVRALVGAEMMEMELTCSRTHSLLHGTINKSIEHTFVKNAIFEVITIICVVLSWSTWLMRALSTDYK